MALNDAGKANRTINMDVGVLSRVLKFCGRWRALADHVKNLPERQRPIGRALTSEERRHLFDVAASNPEWEHVYCAAIVAANTRCVRWSGIDTFVEVSDELTSQSAVERVSALR